MEKGFKKRDRTARLLRLETLLWQYKNGLKIQEIASKCSISMRTAYRDMEALENELKVPIWENAGRRGISEGYFLPQISFTQSEAMILLLAARTMCHLALRHNPSIIKSLLKFASILPPFLKDHFNSTIEYLENMPQDERKRMVFNNLIQAWVTRHPVTFTYQYLTDEKPADLTIEPYFIEPSPANQAIFLIGFCRQDNAVLTYRINQIISDVRIEPEIYSIPVTFNINQYLQYSWGGHINDNPEVILLRFPSRISHALINNPFHSSEVIKVLPDGSLLISLKIQITDEFFAWVLGWGKLVEVLKPASLRKRVADNVKDMYGMYSNKKAFPDENISNDFIANMMDISDDQWDSIYRLLPTPSQNGRPRIDDRQVINGILKVLQFGWKWKDIPRRYGAASTCFTRYKLWQKQGIWNEIWKVVNNDKISGNSHQGI